MKVTVDIELQESEVQYGTQLTTLLSSIAETVNTRVVTDKAALTALLKEAAVSNRSDTIISELSRRLAKPELYADCLDVLASILFDPARLDKPEASLPFFVAISRISDAPVRIKVRDDLVSLVLRHLLVARPLEAPREPLLPHCDVLANFVRLELIPARAALSSVVLLIRGEQTRSAGLTLLGKLVESACDAVRRCDKAVLDQLRQALSVAQEDIFMYDIEYVSEPLGWTAGNHGRQLALQRSCRPPSDKPAGSAIVSGLSFVTSSTRELLVAASMDGSVTTYDWHTSNVTSTLVLPNHTPIAIDINPRRFLAVSCAPKVHGLPPVVRFYSDDGGRWSDFGSYDKEKLRIVSALKWNRSGSHFALGETTTNQETFLRIYDTSRGQQQVQECSNHSDMITALYATNDRDFVTGSRDKSLLYVDTRAPSVNLLAQLGGTVTTITGEGDYIVAGSLDRRLTLHDLRMPITILAQRDFESPVISASLGQKGLCAVGAMTGLFFVNLNVPTLPSSKAEGSGGNRYHCVTWNASQTHVFAGRDGAVVDVFVKADPMIV